MGDPEVDLARLRGVRVMLAEDNVTNQLVATQMLENLGAAVDVAADGAIALRLLAEKDYDLLLVDIEMPRVSGLEVIRKVRAGAAPLADRPIIALTAYAMKEHRETISQAGADGLIPKPIISIEQFGRDILKYMDAAAVRRADAARVEVEDGAKAAAGATIDTTIFDTLANSIGADAMKGLLSKVEDDLTAVRDQIVDAVATGDTFQMRSATHILISVAGAVGGVKLQAQAEELNQIAHEGDYARMRELSRAALVELEGLLEFVGSRRTSERA